MGYNGLPLLRSQSMFDHSKRELIERLRQLMHSDRSPTPPAFVGREQEIGDTLAKLRAVRKDPTGSGVGLTIVLHGAPGAGKTALLAAIQRRVAQEFAAAEPGEQPKGVFLINAAPALFNSAWGLSMRLLQSLSPDEHERERRIYTRSFGASSGVASLVTAGAERSWTERDPVPHRDMESWLEEHAQAWRKAAIVLLCDEAQALCAEATEQLMALHGGRHGVAVLLVFAGLPNTPRILAECKISRLAMGQPRHIGILPLADAIRAARKAFDVLGVEGMAAAKDRWAERMGVESQGWPQHLANYQIAAYEVIADNQGVIDGADFESMLADGALRREWYYERRMESLSLAVEAVPPVARALQRTANGLTIMEAKTAAAPVLHALGLSFADFYSEGIRTGVLTATTGGRVGMEIPTFRDWAAARAPAPEPTDAPDGPRRETRR